MEGRKKKGGRKDGGNERMLELRAEGKMEEWKKVV